MEFRHLRSFTAVAETLNFRRAAESLHVSAPALSKQIRLLEESVGTRLFERSTASVRLTPAGGVFLGHARDLLARAQHAVDLTREAASGQPGQLLIGNWGGLVIGEFLPKCMSGFSRRFPESRFVPIDFGATDPVAALLREEIDLGLIPVIEPFVFPSGISRLSAISAPLYLMVAAEHQLARRKAVSPNEFIGEHLAFRKGSRVSLHAYNVRYALLRRGYTVRRWEELVGWDSVRALVASGRAMTLVSSLTGKSNTDDVVLVPLRGVTIQVDFTAIWRSHETSPLVLNFLRTIEQQSALLRRHH